jgi:hypothetical protein
MAPNLINNIIFAVLVSRMKSTLSETGLSTCVKGLVIIYGSKGFVDSTIKKSQIWSPTHVL